MSIDTHCQKGMDHMKFIHIADVHLGASPDRGMSWSSTRQKEIYNTFQRIIDICNENKVDLLLIAGDLFHRQPLLRELREVNYSLSKLTHTQVVMIAGNHDYIGVRSSYNEFEWAEHIHMITDEKLTSIVLHDIKTEVYGFSYHTRNIQEDRLSDVNCEKNSYLHILLAHGGEEKNVPFNQKRLLESGFDYIALGHIHKPEMIARHMAYSGSLEPLDKNELGDRGYIIGEIDDETREIKKIDFIRLSKRVYIKKDIQCDKETTSGMVIDQIRDFITENGKENMYRFHLIGVKEECTIFDMEAIKELGNIVEIMDDVVPDYDFDELYRENSDNIIGLYIEKIKQNSNHNEITRKALYYGIGALLGAKNN